MVFIDLNHKHFFRMKALILRTLVQAQQFGTLTRLSYGGCIIVMKPVNPVKPVEPVNPLNPVKPVNPVKPMNPKKVMRMETVVRKVMKPVNPKKKEY